VRRASVAQQRIGLNLRLAREGAGLDQTQLAKAVGMSRVAVNGHENGKVVSDKALRKYADFYGVVGQFEP
jgi:transcriptional regulator with XRE-family HTH domain